LLVGADRLSIASQHVWQLLASDEGTVPERNGTFEEGVLYGTPHSLDRVLQVMVQAVPCQGAWLAVRVGDVLEVRAQWNSSQAVGMQMSLAASHLWGRPSRENQIVSIERSQEKWAYVPQKGLRRSTKAWVGIPLLVGKRLIGQVAMWRGEAFTGTETHQLAQLASQMTPVVDTAVAFSEVSDHLRRMDLLNDFALSVSSALELDRIVERVFVLLGRTFHTELITLFLMPMPGQSIHEYRNQNGQLQVQDLSLEKNSFLAEMIQSGTSIREDDIRHARPARGRRVEKKYLPVHEAAASAVAAPLIHQGRTIGVLLLESIQPNRFSLYDEQLLVVVAGYLAGLVENSNLREETEARARNMRLIQEVVQQVLGLTDVNEMAQIAAELMAKYFVYELAVVMLADQNGQLVVRGIGGTAPKSVRKKVSVWEKMPDSSIIQRVFNTGSSMLVNDVEKEPLYQPVPDWDAGAAMYVALHATDDVLGVIKVESQKKNAITLNDLHVLESLAAILASVVSSAGQYQRLQDTIIELEETQQELQARVGAQKDAEARLIQAAKLAAVGEMAAGVAHELNNPLTTVVGFTELVMDELPDDSAQKSDLDLVLREARRARTVVRRLLDFARQSETVRTRSDLNEVVTDVLSLMRHLLHTSGVEVILNLEKDLPWIIVDRNQMKQVVLNLLHNALNAMPRNGGQIFITTKKQTRYRDQWLTVSIRDTGGGIPPEYLNRIFEPFFTTRLNQGGTGLGLSVTYGIVTDHRGLIEVESQVNMGSTFTVWLPLEG
jgi:signal transduction histidine kinase